MFKYLILNIVVMAIIYAILFRCSKRNVYNKQLIILIIILLVMTAVFDSIIIALGLVTYDLNTILGIYVGKAPIEDFAYALAAAFIVPVLWENGAKK